MEMHQLKYFVEAAEAGSFSQAAKQCEIAQPSLSQQIKCLERSLGADLFDRVGRGVVLTDAGRALLPRARRILAEARDIQQRLRDDLDSGTGPFHFGVIPTMAPYLLPAILSELHGSYPLCEPVIVEDFTERLIDGLMRHELDAALLSTPIEQEGIEVEVLGSERLLVALPADHELSRQEELKLEELRGEPLLVLHEMHCLGRQMGEFCNARKLSRKVLFRSSQLATILELVRHRQGVSLIPEMAIRPSRLSDLVFRPLKRSCPTREIAFARRADRLPHGIAEHLSVYLRHRLKMQ